jgi:DUF4097 and DUF4098 domain-containing protein YvlB
MLHRQSRIVVRTAILLALFAAICARPGLAFNKDFRQTYALQPGGSFDLQNVNGTVEVQGWDRDEIEVRAVKTAKDSEADLDRVTIEVNAQPSSVSVNTRYPQDKGVEVAVEYLVHVPHSAHVDRLATVNGTLRVSAVSNIGDLRTVNGNIEVYDGEGALRAHVTNGNVHIEMARLLGSEATVAETTNGSVLLALPADAQADLEARCLNGSFSSELPVALASSDQPRVVRGKIGRGGSALRLRTINGGIQIALLRSTV